MRQFVHLAFCLAACLFAGCSSSPKKSTTRSIPFKAGSGPIEELHLFGVPVALNMDASPGPDGVGGIVYGSNRKTAKGIPITSGTLEVLAFDGSLKGPELKEATPFKTWTFTPEQLKAFQTQRSVGMGYQLALRWDAPPKSNRVTIFARYISPKGLKVSSSPSSVSLAVK